MLFKFNFLAYSMYLFHFENKLSIELLISHNVGYDP